MDLKAAVPTIDQDNKSAAWLVGSLTVFGALLSAVGIGNGDVPRVLRNDTLPAAFTFTLVILAAFSAAFAGWWTRDAGAERIWLRASGGLLTLAALFALWTGVESASEQPKPVLTAQILTDARGASSLHFEVKDSGLRASDKMTVLIGALVESGGKLVRSATLYGASLGPDAGGHVDHSGDVPVPPAPANDLELQAWVGKRHTCYAEGVTAATGCTRLHINRLFEKPQLALAWRDARHASAGLNVTLSAHDVGEHRVVLRVIDAHSHSSLLNAIWPSNATGTVEESITAIVPRATKRICVVASTTEPTPSCPAPEGSGDAAILTGAPPY